MTSKARNPDRFIAFEQHEKLLCREGIPAHFWNPRIENVVFEPTESRGSKKSAAAQLHWLRALVEQPPRRRPLVVIASSPTDTAATYLAMFCMLRLWRKHNYGAAILNVANDTAFVENKPKYLQSRCAVLLGLHKTSTSQRKEKLRDVVNELYYSFRMVIVGGCTEPEQWMMQEVGVYPDAAFLVKDMRPSKLKND